MTTTAGLDHDVAVFVTEHRTPALTHLAHIVTAFGNEVTLALLSALTIGLLLRLGRTRAAAVFTIGMAGSAVLTVGVKLLVSRDRPGAEFRLGPADSSFSFPSGHTMNTTVFLLMVVLALWPALARARRVVALAIAVTISVAVGLSRLYLGYHWTTDVVAGLAIGAIWSGVVVRLSLAAAPDAAGPDVRAPESTPHSV